MTDTVTDPFQAELPVSPGATPVSATTRIGVINGAVEATTREFVVVLDDEATMQLDDLIVTRQTLADGTEVAHYAIVTELTSRIEGMGEPSDTQYHAEGTMPGKTARCAIVSVLRVDPERWVAPCPGAEVEHAHDEDRTKALYADQMDGKLPIGFDQSDEPIYADWSFMNGVQGGHVSISGISGVAAKTSYALFLLYMMLESDQGRALLGQGAAGARALVFNVKGEDLMHLDKPHQHFPPEQKEKWAALGVADPGPFKSVGFYSPPVVGSGTSDQLVSSSQTRPDATVFGWTPEAFIKGGLLRFCLTDNDQQATQVGFVEQAVRAELARHAYPMVGRPGAVVICAQPHTTSRAFERAVEAKPPSKTAADGTPIHNFYDLIDVLDEKLEVTEEWAGRHAPGSVTAFLRRLSALAPRLGHLVREGVEQVKLERSVTIVDIHSLHESAQRMVVGSLVQEVFDSKQATGREPLRFIGLDELNRYAPREGHGPLRELFVDIAERGRSLGVFLIGAQQAASRVAAPVVSQPSLKVVGRLDASEAAEYKFLTPEQRERATRFMPGTMICVQPRVPVPIPLRFPFSPYATNVGDAGQTAEAKQATQDAFASL